VGIVIGTAIFKTPTFVLQNVTYEWQSYLLWLLGGLLSLCGALCYAELATSFSRNGGEYIFLSRGYGAWLGFLFGWAQLTAVHSGTIGTMAYTFADYATHVYAFPAWINPWLAAGTIGILTLMNLAGTSTGRRLQNLLSLSKVTGLLLLVIAGMATPAAETMAPDPTGNVAPRLGLALVFVLYAYGGWNDSAYVATEVQQRERNLPRALIVGISGITIIYLLVNYACLNALGMEAARMTQTPAADVVKQALGPLGAQATSVLVMTCSLGAINAMIFTGSRVYTEIGRDHGLFDRANKQAQAIGIPRGALIAPGLFACGLILAVGTRGGQQAIDSTLQLVSVPAIPWDQYSGGFDTLVAGTAPIFWTFFLLTCLSLFLLRRRTPERLNSFRVPLYPLPPVIFCGVCCYMLYSSIAYAKWLSLLGFAPLAVGLVLFLLTQQLRARVSQSNVE